MKRKKIILSLTAVILVLGIITLSMLILPNKNTGKDLTCGEVEDYLKKLTYTSSDSSYDTYLDECSGLDGIKEDIEIDKNSIIKNSNQFSFAFDCDNGVFAIRLTYRMLGSDMRDVECKLLLNNVSPYNEADAIVLKHHLNSLTTKEDGRGNQYPVDLVNSEDPITVNLTDSTGYHIQPLFFIAKSGNNTCTLNFDNENIVIDNILLFNPMSEEKAETITEENDLIEADSIVIQAEFPYYRTDTSITELCDRSSPVTVPAFKGIQRWNSFGGTSWSGIGQEVAWKVEVEKAGYYRLATRYKQSYSSGKTSFRSVLIDGKPISEELKYWGFPYSNDWEVSEFTNDDGKPYYFYLSAGEHIISMSVSLGSNAEIINLSQKALFELNTINRKIIMLTGSNPDEYRDYQLAKKMPEVLKAMENQLDILNGISQLLYGNQSGMGEASATLSKLIIQLNQFVEYPESIPSELIKFQSNITAFSAWMQEQTNHPLALDYIELAPKGQELQKPKASIFKRLGFSIGQFIRSFSEEYGIIGNIYSDSKSIDVWMTQGRDQYQIIKQQIDNGFTKEKNISVNLKLVSGGLLESIAGGIAPDVYLFGSAADPVNLAARGALLELTQFDDYDQVIKDYSEHSIVPFTYDSKVYALPLSESFLMMFVRDDILSEIGMQVPKTMQDIYNSLSTLQQNHMEFGFPVPSNGDISSFALILFQEQQKLYNNHGQTVAFDTKEAMNSFEKWLKLYTDYSSSVTYNFVNRFRTGSMPIGIIDFSTYNTLQVSAPEIKGLWSMHPIPTSGTGEIGASVSTVSSSFIIKTTEYPEESWEFLKWWVGAEEQYNYATAIENRLGTSARFATANIKAFSRLSWDADTMAKLQKQRKNSFAVEQVPGGYFLSRHVDNIYRTVINEGSDIRKTVLNYTDIINAELKRKRQEFGLEDIK